MSMLKDLLAISGYGGLFKFISQGRNGVIVEDLQTQKRINIPTSTKISALDDIAIFTYEEEESLKNVFRKIYEKAEGKPDISPKASGEELKSFFAEILPNYDEDRVYVSDIKKVIKWYQLLYDLGQLNFEEEEEEEEENKHEEQTDNHSQSEQQDNTSAEE